MGDRRAVLLVLRGAVRAAQHRGDVRVRVASLGRARMSLVRWRNAARRAAAFSGSFRSCGPAGVRYAVGRNAPSAAATPISRARARTPRATRASCRSSRRNRRNRPARLLERLDERGEPVFIVDRTDRHEPVFDAKLLVRERQRLVDLRTRNSRAFECGLLHHEGGRAGRRVEVA